jgi:hypothetical protein
MATESLSIDSEGTVYCNVDGRMTKVSWVSLDGIRLYLRGPGEIDSPNTETSVLDLVAQWAKQTPEPAIGMGVTFHWGTDYYPYTIIRFLSYKTLIIQQDLVVHSEKDGGLEAIRDAKGWSSST